MPRITRIRRSKIELIRDLLLAVAMAPGQQEKPTRLMYATGTSWSSIMGRDANPENGVEAEEGLIDLAVRKNLLEDIGPSIIQKKGPRGKPSTKTDKRTFSVYKITERGLLVLRLMDLIWLFLEGEQPQVRMPPAILRILARATNYGESLEGIVKNLAYSPRLSVDAEQAIENLLGDMKDDSMIISEAPPDTDRLTKAVQLVADDRVQSTFAEKSQAAHEMPAEFFVNKVLEGVEELEAITGVRVTPVQTKSTFKVLEPVILDESTRTTSGGLQCTLCGHRVYSPSKNLWRISMRNHFKAKHLDHTPVFE